MIQCAVCYRTAENEYCNLHDAAYRNILQAYQQWKNSKTITWPAYLKQVMENPNSGQWAIEVCRHLLSKGQDAPPQEEP